MALCDEHMCEPLYRWNEWNPTRGYDKIIRQTGDHVIPSVSSHARAALTPHTIIIRTKTDTRSNLGVKSIHRGLEESNE